MSKYPNAFYRVSVKAVIKNNNGHVLLVKEGSDEWSLPGGGLDHGEAVLPALEREMNEELGIKTVKSATFDHVFTLYASTKEAWYMWLLYNVEIDMFDVSSGIDVSDAKYIDTESFKESEIKSQQRIYQALTGLV